MTNRIKADLHNHFSTWGSGWGNFDNIVDKISKNFGHGVIGLANCEDKRYETFVDSSSGNSKYERVEVGDDKNALWLPQKNLLIVRGQEVFTKQGHFLVLGTPKKHKIASRKLTEVVKQANEMGAGTIAIHPYLQGTGKYLEQHPELLDQIDSIEIYNASLELFSLFGKNYNGLTKRLFVHGINHNIGCCAFTDGHSINAIGTSYTMIPKLDITSSETLRSSLKQALEQTIEKKHLVKNPATIDSLVHGVQLYSWVAKEKILGRKQNY